MAKYQKRSTVINAFQVGIDGNYGVLGDLISTDWIIYVANGDIHTMDDAQFQTKYIQTLENAQLVGDEWA